MTEEKPKDEPKIYIDDDWKKQAKAEKERLADQEKQAAKEGRPGAGPPGTLPAPDLVTLISSFLTQTLLALGLIELPNGRRTFNLDLAKFNVGLLEVIEAKTRGNLTSEEQETLNQALHQARMAFVEVATKQGPIG